MKRHRILGCRFSFPLQSPVHRGAYGRAGALAGGKNAVMGNCNRYWFSKPVKHLSQF